MTLKTFWSPSAKFRGKFYLWIINNPTSWVIFVLTWRDTAVTEIQKAVFILNVIYKAHEKTDIHQKLRLGHAEHLLCCRGEWSLILDCLLNYLRT